MYMYSSLLGNWVLKLPWNVPKILYLYGNLRCKDVSWYTIMDMKSQVVTFVTFHHINFTFHKIPQILFYRNKMPEKIIQFILTRIFEVSFEGGPLWLVWLFWQVKPKTSLSIWQNCCPQYCSSVSCWQLLCTLNKYAVAWVGSVQQECRWSIWHMEFLKFQTKFLLNGKHPFCTIMYQSRPILKGGSCWELLNKSQCMDFYSLGRKKVAVCKEVVDSRGSTVV